MGLSSQNPVSLMEALERVREVRYDRNEGVADLEAARMADGYERLLSYNRAGQFRISKIEAVNFSKLGFYFQEQSDIFLKVKCSFCRRQIHLREQRNLQADESNYSNRFQTLPKIHSLVSPLAPLCWGCMEIILSSELIN